MCSSSFITDDWFTASFDNGFVSLWQTDVRTAMSGCIVSSYTYTAPQWIALDLSENIISNTGGHLYAFSTIFINGVSNDMAITVLDTNTVVCFASGSPLQSRLSTNAYVTPDNPLCYCLAKEPCQAHDAICSPVASKRYARFYANTNATCDTRTFQTCCKSKSADAKRRNKMLSYQWDNQKLVNEAYHRLSEKNIPLWMDIHRGMKGHLSESMAAGIEKAATICCFLTPKYQDSVALPNWKPTGWLGFTITGHKWIDFRDIDTNMDLRIEQLISEIHMLAENKLDYFKDMKPLSFTQNNEEQDFDSGYYYRFTTQWQGDDESVAAVNDGRPENQIMLAETNNSPTQLWKITKTT
ncbi:unnamed protein product [Adineta ricciae]|uniref:TIR domain-containing protein n=1 Tax=Adineta ricciae TaxID=249248 RepID=A0A815N3V7_ADIRI|nr:unnamed protein product [Adineta ricciae]